MTTTLSNRQAGPMTAWTPTFAMSVDEAVAQVRMKREFMQRVMVEGTHYGTIPGTPKPSLWKPGAELLLSAMGLHAVLTDAASPILDITGRDHGGEAFIEYRRACTIYRQIGPTENERMVIARAEGSCNSWETKYRWRTAKPQCPDCRQEAVKFRKDGGAWCDRNSGGCGHSFQPSDERIAGQVLGKIKNPDVADVLNTILKIADKRSYVAGTLLGTGCSDIFTQDLSDDEDPPAPGDEGNGGGPQHRAQSRPATNGGGGRPAAGGISDEQMAELRDLNEQLGDRKWSPALLTGKAKGLGYEKTKAELEGQLGKAPEVTPPTAGGEPGEGAQG